VREATITENGASTALMPGPPHCRAYSVFICIIMYVLLRVGSEQLVSFAPLCPENMLESNLKLRLENISPPTA